MDSTDLYPDLKRSSNVLGFYKWNDSLYIHLADTDRALLYMSKDKVTAPYLRKASAVLGSYTMTDAGVLFITQIFKNGIYEFANMQPRSYYIVNAISIKDKRIILTKRLASDNEGNLVIDIPVSGQFKIFIHRQDQ